MKGRKLVYFALAFIFVLASVFQTQPAPTEAAAKTGYVSISSGKLNVRSGPGSSYKVIGSLSNNAAVTVSGQTKNGWSQITYKKKRAYVASKYLRMYSFLMDKTKVYTYKTNGVSYTHTYEGKNNGWDEWRDSSTRGTFVISENSKGLYLGWPESEYYTEISYPLKSGKTWRHDFDTRITYKITGTNGTVKTQAGTFKSITTVQSSEGYINYYAPKIGLVKQVYRGKTVSELVKLAKK
ncbi:SH3 domain-containing protein [Domibacillus indicus]|uniref:SH3 domain-containing protein n=1 Tax=Domibacillus indicus TaxID=1437523 RepID=UPI000695C4B3|nr:SH3 domain-containing protein [Domibacillus indicus]